MLSMKSSTSCFGIAEMLGDRQPVSPTRSRALGGSVIWRRSTRFDSMESQGTMTPVSETPAEIVSSRVRIAERRRRLKNPVLFGDVVDQLHDQNGSATPAPPKRPVFEIRVGS